MTEKRVIDNTCYFTGHRPERLEMSQKKVINWLYEQVDKAIEDGYTDFILGMQLGVDIWAAEAVLKRKKEGSEVRLIAACVFKGMEGKWEKSWQDRYNWILSKADEIHYIGDVPGRESFFKRDEWMVNNAGRLIGVFTGAPGGTQKTINYARRKNRSVIHITK